MPEYRIPRGYARRHPSYQEVMEGERPTLKYLKASPFLPVAEIEPRHDDPIVIPAGTFVGVISATGGSFVTGAVVTGGLGTTATYSLNHGSGYYALVPAASGPYKLTYTATDTDTTFYTPGTINLDTNAVVASAGTSTKFIGIVNGGLGATGQGVKPLGVAYQDIYASWLGDNYTNYDRQPNIGFLTSNKVIQIPAVTVNEQNIEPGDLVVVDGFETPNTNAWAPQSLVSNTTAVASSPGRLRKWSDIANNATISAANIARLHEYVVGRCLRKTLIAYTQGISIGTKLGYAISANQLTSLSQVGSESRNAGRVQTVPGLGLAGSGTLGVGGHLLTAKSDHQGAFWALEILVGTY
jgi:hypothetical protein